MAADVVYPKTRSKNPFPRPFPIINGIHKNRLGYWLVEGRKRTKLPDQKLADDIYGWMLVAVEASGQPEDHAQCAVLAELLKASLDAGEN